MAQIQLYGDIGDSWWEEEPITGKAIAAQLKEIPEDEPIDLRINSSGGDVGEALTIYNLLKNRPTTTYIDGYCLSAASFIALASDRVISPEGSIWMLHNPHTIAFGDAKALRKSADILDTHRDAVVGIYAAKTGKSEEEIISTLQEETWLTGAEAVDFGLADELGDAPAETPVLNALPPWIKVSAKAKRKLKTVGLLPKPNRVAAKATIPQQEERNVPDNEQQPDLSVQMSVLQGEVTMLRGEITARDEAIAQRDQAIAQREQELKVLQRATTITNLYNRIRNAAEDLVKSNAPKLSTAEFEALGFTGDRDADIKALLANDQAETSLNQADFYVKMSANRPAILQTALYTGSDEIPPKEDLPEENPQYKADMQRFQARLKR